MMKLLRLYINGSSILESVIALSVLSVVVYLSISIFSNCYSLIETVESTIDRQKARALFYEYQFIDRYNLKDLERINIDDQMVSTNLTKLTITVIDSIKDANTKIYYINER